VHQLNAARRHHFESIVARAGRQFTAGGWHSFNQRVLVLYSPNFLKALDYSLAQGVRSTRNSVCSFPPLFSSNFKAGMAQSSMKHFQRLAAASTYVEAGTPVLELN